MPKGPDWVRHDAWADVLRYAARAEDQLDEESVSYDTVTGTARGACVFRQREARGVCQPDVVVFQKTEIPQLHT